MLGFPQDVEPDMVQIFRHEHAIPQYELSSGARFAAIKRIEQAHPGLILGGNLRDGIGMADRIRQAVAMGLQINWLEKALQLDAFHAVTWLTLRPHLSHFTAWFDADCTVI